MECLQYLDSESYEDRIFAVLNLVISGMPSILHKKWLRNNFILCFKPCYKWNAFNTMKEKDSDSIKLNSFKPCYKWNAFNTKIVDSFIILVVKF